MQPAEEECEPEEPEEPNPFTNLELVNPTAEPNGTAPVQVGGFTFGAIPAPHFDFGPGGFFVGQAPAVNSSATVPAPPVQTGINAGGFTFVPSQSSAATSTSTSSSSGDTDSSEDTGSNNEDENSSSNGSDGNWSQFDHLADIVAGTFVLVHINGLWHRVKVLKANRRGITFTLPDGRVVKDFKDLSKIRKPL